MNVLKLLEKTGLIPTWKPTQSPELTSKYSSSRARMLDWARGQQGSLAGLSQGCVSQGLSCHVCKRSFFIWERAGGL